MVYGRIGLCNQEFGSLASWLVDVINILTGHFDTPGGAMFPRPAAWSITTQPLPGLEGGAPEFGRWQTRVRGAKEVLGQVPVSCMAEEIATPGEGQLKALITVAGNPVLSTPRGDRLDEVLPMLEAMISVDLWLNETTRHADVILPGLSPLEQPHHDDLMLQFAIHSIANYSAPVFDPGRSPARVGDPGPADRPVHRHAGRGCRRRRHRRRLLRLSVPSPRDSTARRSEATTSSTGPAGGPERILDLTLRTGPFGDRYGENPGGLTPGQTQGQSERDRLRARWCRRLPEILGTPDKKIRLAPQYLLDDLPRLAARIGRGPPSRWCW